MEWHPTEGGGAIVVMTPEEARKVKEAITVCANHVCCGGKQLTEDLGKEGCIALSALYLASRSPNVPPSTVESVS